MNVRNYTNDLKVVPVDGNYLYRIVNWDTFTPYDKHKNKEDYVFVYNGNVYATWDNLRSLVSKNLPFSSTSKEIIVVKEDEKSQDFSQQIYLTTIEQDLYLNKVCESLAEKHGFNRFNVEKKYNSHSVEFSVESPAVFDSNPFIMKEPTNEKSLTVELKLSEGFFVSQCVFYSEEEKELHLKEMTDKLLSNKVEEQLKILESREK